MNKLNILWHSGATLLSLFFMLNISACQKGTKNKGKEQEKKYPVQVMQPVLTSIEDVQNFSATVEPAVSNNISPQMGGRIKKILVEIGQTVARGQLLAVMDGSTLEQANIQLEEQKANYARIDELYRVGGISKAEWEARKRALDLAQTSQRNILENTQLRSPICGTITARNYEAGDVMSPTLPLFVVQQLNPVKLRIHLPESYFPRIKKGMKVTVSTNSLPGESFDGHVSLIHPTINPQNHSFIVEVNVNNPQRKLTAGMYAQVELSFGQKQAWMIHDRAIVKQMGSSERYIYLVKEDGRAYRHDVELGITQGTQVEVVSNLPEGCTIVTEGASILKDGSMVEVSKNSSK